MNILVISKCWVGRVLLDRLLKCVLNGAAVTGFASEGGVLDNLLVAVVFISYQFIVANTYLREDLARSRLLGR